VKSTLRHAHGFTKAIPCQYCLAAEYNTSSTVDLGTYSGDLFTAASCSDYPLLFDVSAPPPTRRMQLDAVVDATERKRRALFATFIISEALSSSANLNPLALCLHWPAPNPANPQTQLIQPKLSLPNVPTLILNGEFDSVTSAKDSRQTAQQFPNAT
jgi:pimeloyl-ACP methyl ester carboxylesterase